MNDISYFLNPGQYLSLNIGPVTEVRVEDIIGTGGFATVCRVTCCRTGVEYALKVLRDVVIGAEHVSAMQLVERIQREAGVSIDSPHVIKAYGMRQWDEQTYLILFEFFQGHSLREAVSGLPLNHPTRRDILRQILVGVEDAHRHNIIHRDLKPDNVLVGPTMNVKIIDFGIAKFKDKNITVAGQWLGTPFYMAPEMFVEGASTADARTDIFAVGHLFYELAMGKHFWYRAGWDLSQFLAYLSTRPQTAIDLSDFSCAFLPNAYPVIHRMMRVDPTERYASVRDVMQDLGMELPPTRSLSPSDSFLLRSAMSEPKSDLPVAPLLIVESGTNAGARTVLGLTDGEQRVMGRQDIAGSDTSISRRHLEFKRQENRYFVRDAGSKNGTLVSGQRTHEEFIELKHDDRILVGDVFLRFAFLEIEEDVAWRELFVI